MNATWARPNEEKCLVSRSELRRDKFVMITVLGRICAMLGCNFGEIMDYVPSWEADIWCLKPRLY